MPKDPNNQKPLTLNELAKYNRDVLLPAMSGTLATKKDLEALVSKKEFEGFRKSAFEVFAAKQDLKELEERLDEKWGKRFDKVHTHLDKILSKVDKFDTEHKVVSVRQTRIGRVLDIFFEVLKRRGLFVPEDIQKLTKQDILTIVK